MQPFRSLIQHILLTSLPLYALILLFDYLTGSPAISKTYKGFQYSTKYQKIFKGIILCGIFSSFYDFGTVSASLPSEFLLPYPSQEIQYNSFASHNISFSMEPISYRLLQREEEETPSISTPDIPETFSSSADIRTLSMGKVLSTLKLNPETIILSHNNQLAFLILKFYGTLKVIDISDDQNPIIIGSLENLTHLHGGLHHKKLTLSADGKTLFATTIEYLQIIDVSDPHNPVLKTTLQDPLFANITTDYLSFYLPTMALSSDEKMLYVAGVGLQIINVTNISRPEILFSMHASQRYKKLTSLALFPDSKTLLYGDKTLDFYDVSDPTKPELKHSYYSFNISISSVLLSKNAKKVYVTGLNSEKRPLVLLEELDISQQESPKSLGQYKFGPAREGEPSIISISPNETNIFVMTGTLTTTLESPAEMIGFDLLKKQIMVQSNNFFFNTNTFVMIPGTNTVITNSKLQFQITKLFKDYPNSKNFCFTNNSRGNFQFPEKVKFIAPSTDQSILFALSEEGYFESYDFTNKPLLSSFKLDFYKGFKTDFQLFIQNSSALIRYSDAFYVFNISDPTNITLQGSISPTGKKKNNVVQTVYHAPQEHMIVALMWTPGSGKFQAKIINYSNMSSIKETPVTSLSDYNLKTKAYLLDRRKILFFLTDGLMVYNISNPTTPKFISSQQLAPFEDPVNFLSVASSADEKTLFVVILDMRELAHLYTIDVSDLKNIKILSELELPKIVQDQDEEEGKHPLILSRDMKRGFLVTDRDILVIDFKNLASPALLGMISLGILSDQGASNFFLSSDEKVGYLSGPKGQFLQVNLDMSYALYLQQEKFFLGKKYSDALLFLQSDKKDSTEYAQMDQSDYKIAKLLISDLQISPDEASPALTFSSLPSWITFDYENQVLSVESKKQSDLGSYTLYSISSRKVPLKVFKSVLPNSILSEDMITLLIGQGYMDNQQFLTSGFGSYEKFLLPSQYMKYSEIIYSTLQFYRIETFTDFELLSSLKLLTISSGKFSIKTPSNSSVFVDVRLHSSNGAKAEFLQKNYGILHPIITNQKSRLTIEGPLDLINQALQDLVINLKNDTDSSCLGEITINDKMNPPITEAYPNITKYFFKNEVPRLNTSHPLMLQQQIDQETLYTGQAFTISIDPNTFMDSHSEILSYELIQPSSNRQGNLPPSWLTLQNGLTLKGTPPEDFFHREVHLVLIVKNEFKQMEASLVLNIKISLLFAGKLLMRYSPYILGIVGLIVSANRIYSILMKKRYRHPKNFYVRAGEEITSSVIFPIKFIAEERAEGELILKKLFLTENSDETKITQAIRETVNGLDGKTKGNLKLYCQGGDYGKKGLNNMS